LLLIIYPFFTLLNSNSLTSTPLPSAKNQPQPFQTAPLSYPNTNTAHTPPGVGGVQRAHVAMQARWEAVQAAEKAHVAKRTATLNTQIKDATLVAVRSLVGHATASVQQVSSKRHPASS
jgi:hypothetical protein